MCIILSACGGPMNVVRKDPEIVPAKIEKNKFAEVSTPFQLRKEMLDIMPKSFWRNKKNKKYVLSNNYINAPYVDHS